MERRTALQCVSLGTKRILSVNPERSCSGGKGGGFSRVQGCALGIVREEFWAHCKARLHVYHCFSNPNLFMHRSISPVRFSFQLFAFKPHPLKTLPAKPGLGLEATLLMHAT